MHDRPVKWLVCEESEYFICLSILIIQSYPQAWMRQRKNQQRMRTRNQNMEFLHLVARKGRQRWRRRRPWGPSPHHQVLMVSKGIRSGAKSCVAEEQEWHHGPMCLPKALTDDMELHVLPLSRIWIKNVILLYFPSFFPKPTTFCPPLPHQIFHSVLPTILSPSGVFHPLMATLTFVFPLISSWSLMNLCLMMKNHPCSTEHKLNTKRLCWWKVGKIISSSLFRYVSLTEHFFRSKLQLNLFFI